MHHALTGYPTSVVIRPQARDRLVALLGIAALGLFLLSVGASVMYLNDLPASRMAISLFGVDEEASIPTWWATVVLWSLGLVTAAIGLDRATDRRSLVAWWALAAGFVFLSADEGAQLHERAGFFVGVTGTLHDARWVFVWLPLAVLAGIPVLWQLWRASRRLVIGLMIGAMVFLSGAVGVEVVNSTVRHHYRSETQAAIENTTPRQNVTHTMASIEEHADKQNFAYLIGSSVEELFEMLGVVIWFAVVLREGRNGAAMKPRQGNRATERRPTSGLS